MAEKKIAECVKVLINLGNFSNITVAKYDERTISYDTEEERLEKEQQHSRELIEGVIRVVRDVPHELQLDNPEVAEKLKIDPNALEKVEDRMTKEMPKWLGDEDVPNIANMAAEVKNETDNTNVTKKQEKAKSDSELDELLGSGEELEDRNTSVEEEAKPEEAKPEDISNEQSETAENSENSGKTDNLEDDLNDLFGDDDLFE